MSSGACRALVSLLLTLTATFVLVTPVAAKTESLVETSTSTYSVDPNTGDIAVDHVLTFRNDSGQAFASQQWGPIYIEDEVRLEAPSSNRFKVRRNQFKDLPGPWKEMWLQIPKIDGQGGRDKVTISYTIKAGIGNPDEVPARVDGSYIYLCVPGQPTDRGQTKIEIQANRPFTFDQNGSEMLAEGDSVLSSGDLDPRHESFFACIDGTRTAALVPETFTENGRVFEIQAWRDAADWRFPVEQAAPRHLREIREFLGQGIPGEGPVVIRQTPNRDVGGYASAHSSPGIVQVDESGLRGDGAKHQLAHAWFGADIFIDQWLREGLAEWTASATLGSVCSEVADNPDGLDLRDWQVVQPTSDPDNIDATIAGQLAASCGIVNAYVERMGREQWLNEVVPSLLNAETKYIGTSGPSAASVPTVDYREFLDAVDERGLAPVAKAAPGYAGDVSALDLAFAQDLLRAYEIPVAAGELENRLRARQEYHQFLEDAAPLGAPLAVREAMDSWQFDKAVESIEKSREVVAALQEIDLKVPGLGLMEFVQPSFEAARRDDELDAVVTETAILAEAAREIFEPLAELSAASPPGWDRPAVVRQAIEEQRFDDILGAMDPAIRAVQAVANADAALPDTGIAERYRPVYEATATTGDLRDLAGDVEDVERLAVGTSEALADLQAEVGEWQIPAAVGELVAQGELQAARQFVNDARDVVIAATEADTALPGANVRSGIRDEFESAGTASAMAALKQATETKRDEAQTVDAARRTLNRLVPTWQTPAVVDDPIEAGDFATAAVASAAAREWIESADQANKDLPDLDALNRIRVSFEGATTLEQLVEGASLAQDQRQAATAVARAIEREAEPRDMLTSIGLIATDTKKPVDEALQAAIAGDVETALQKAQESLATIDGASTTGGLRLAGLVFVGVAVIGVLGLWLMLRREHGPPWARQTKPHWVEEEEKKKSRWGRK